jgi:hypothetical protein
MLTDIERIIFIVLSLLTLGAAYKVGQRIYRVIMREQGALGTDNMSGRVRRALGVFLTQRTVLKRRPLASIFHTMVAWGFTFYLLVNVVDVAVAWFAALKGLYDNPIGYAYLLLADLLTVSVLAGMVALLIRRFITGRQIFGFNKNVVLHPKASFGIKRDSTIVGVFILFHVGSRYLATTIAMALAGGNRGSPLRRWAATCGPGCRSGRWKFWSTSSSGAPSARSCCSSRYLSPSTSTC